MSNNTILSKLNPLEEIDQSQSPFESKRNREGDWCLFFKKQEVNELFGHYVKFYPNGVLLILKDEAKDFLRKNYPNIKYESKSFIFYNTENVENINDKEPIFSIHNRNKNIDNKTYDEPLRDIDIIVCEHYLYVKESIGNKTKEYLIDVITGDKTKFITDEDQLTIDI